MHDNESLGASPYTANLNHPDPHQGQGEMAENRPSHQKEHNSQTGTAPQWQSQVRTWRLCREGYLAMIKKKKLIKQLKEGKVYQLTGQGHSPPL